MVRANYSFKLENIVLDRANSGGGFSSKYIQPGPNPSILYRANQCRLIDDLGARSVDEVRARFHCREELFVDQVSSGIVESDVNADHVGCRRDLQGTLLHFDSASLGSFESQRA